MHLMMRIICDCQVYAKKKVISSIEKLVKTDIISEHKHIRVSQSVLDDEL